MVSGQALPLLHEMRYLASATFALCVSHGKRRVDRGQEWGMLGGPGKMKSTLHPLLALHILQVGAPSTSMLEHPYQPSYKEGTISIQHESWTWNRSMKQVSRS